MSLLSLGVRAEPFRGQVRVIRTYREGRGFSLRGISRLLINLITRSFLDNDCDLIYVGILGRTFPKQAILALCPSVTVKHSIGTSSLPVNSAALGNLYFAIHHTGRGLRPRRSGSHVICLDACGSEPRVSITNAQLPMLGFSFIEVGYLIEEGIRTTDRTRIAFACAPIHLAITRAKLVLQRITVRRNRLPFV